MEQKLIIRAACVYRDWVVSQSGICDIEKQSLVHQIIESSKKKLRQMEKWIDLCFEGMQPRLQMSKWDKSKHVGIVCKDAYEHIGLMIIPETEKAIDSKLATVSAMIEHMYKSQCRSSFTLKQAIDEVRAIVDAWPGTTYKNKVLSVPISPVVLEEEAEEVDLGGFRINLTLSSPLVELDIRAINPVLSGNNYEHPHVQHGTLCQGEGKLPMVDAIKQGRLEDYFRVVEATLRTYNPESPHDPLASWYDPDHEGEYYCPICEAWRPEEEALCCTDCDTEHCTECEGVGSCCTQCGEYFCGNCIGSCSGCGEPTCSECSLECDSCDKFVCVGCAGRCYSCQNDVCLGCQAECECCSETMCSSCVKYCGCCGGNICSGCLENECPDCGSTICDTCTRECEDCGVNYCELCVKEHSCLLAESTN